MISILLIITITLLGNCETKNNLCQIQIYLSDQQNSINEFQFNEISKPIEIQTDTFYHAVCITNEKIRSRNMLKLVWNEADLFTNTDSFDSNDSNEDSGNELADGKYQIISKNNYENYENIRVSRENFENKENLRIPFENHENYENIRIPCEHYENHENVKISARELQKL